MGITTVGIRSSRARSAACSGPAPPKATSEKSRGSYPRSTVMSRTAFSMEALESLMMPAAASVTEPSSTGAMRVSMASCAASALRVMSLRRPVNAWGRNRPRTTLASVLVGSVPPRS